LAGLLEIGKFYIFGKAVWGWWGVAGEFLPESGIFIFCGFFVRGWLNVASGWLKVAGNWSFYFLWNFC